MPAARESATGMSLAMGLDLGQALTIFAALWSSGRIPLAVQSNLPGAELIYWATRV